MMPARRLSVFALAQARPSNAAKPKRHQIMAQNAAPVTPASKTWRVASINASHNGAKIMAQHPAPDAGANNPMS